MCIYAYIYAYIIYINIWYFRLPLVGVMTTSSNGNIFRVTGHLCREFTGHRWIPHTEASDMELWCFFFIYISINGWVNNREAGDLRCHHTHYDVTVMLIEFCQWQVKNLISPSLQPISVDDRLKHCKHLKAIFQSHIFHKLIGLEHHSPQLWVIFCKLKTNSCLQTYD